MDVEAIAEAQSRAFAKDVVFAQVESRRHPTVVAYVPGRRMPRVRRMIEPGHTFTGVDSGWAAVIDPRGRPGKDGLLALSPLAVAELTAAVVSAQALGDAQAHEPEVCLGQLELVHHR